MKLTKYGRAQWLAATFVLVAVFLVSCVLMYFAFSAGCFLIVAGLLLWGAFITFFRDPHRVIGQDKTELVAPADGIVKDMELIPNASCEEPVLRELFPCAMRLTETSHDNPYAFTNGSSACNVGITDRIGVTQS